MKDVLAVLAEVNRNPAKRSKPYTAADFPLWPTPKAGKPAASELPSIREAKGLLVGSGMVRETAGPPPAPPP